MERSSSRTKISSPWALALALLLGLSTVSVAETQVYGGRSTGWSAWDTVLDGVMGGLSSGVTEVDGDALRFYGDINFVGGGFSSVSRPLAPPVNLTDIDGFLVVLDTLPEGSVPLALDLSLNTVGSFWTHGATFTARPGTPGTATRHFLPLDTFTRTSWNGRRCQTGCELDPAAVVSRIGVFVLFQEGPFELRIRSIEAVASSEDTSLTPAPLLNMSRVEAAEFLSESVSRGAVLYDKGYPELGVAVHTVALETVLLASGPPKPVQNTICAGLAHVAAQGGSSQELAWMLLRLMEAVLDDLAGEARQAIAVYPEVAHGNWLRNTSSNDSTNCAVGAIPRHVAALESGTQPELVPVSGASSLFAVIKEVGPSMVEAKEPSVDDGGVIRETSSSGSTTSAASAFASGGAGLRAAMCVVAAVLLFVSGALSL